MTKRILLPTLALLLALAPVAASRPARASLTPTATIAWTDMNTGPKTLAVPVGTNGCTGPLVVVYGSSAMQTYILGTAASFCATFTTPEAKAAAPDVEYVAGGDSCPGVDLAADDPNDNVIGVSDVFTNGCTGTFARAASKVAEPGAGPVAVNVVEAITLCNGASAVQGGSPYFNSAANQCLGSATRQ